jgi:hypothetical protein
MIAVALLAAVSTARADVVGPDKRGCPAGFPHARCHGAEYCLITKCTNDSQCPSGSTCAEQRWCVLTLDCSGRFRSDGFVPTYVYGFEGSCAKGESCAAGQKCETIRACAPPLPSRGCACRVGEAVEVEAGGLLLGLAIAGLLAARYLHRARTRSHAPEAASRATR